jgi:hypothetical protein
VKTLNTLEKLTLFNFALKSFDPTNDQRVALGKLDTFFASDKKCFLLKGYAGTGKTFLTKCIADFLIDQKKSVVLMAPTGRASRVLSAKTGYPSTTIHKGIYNLDRLDEIKTGSKGNEKYKFRYNMRNTESNTSVIYLIDEASMISDMHSEDDFFIFGSGRLLKDLMEFIAPTNSSRNDKIIFIGDTAQLPPVTDRKPGALNRKYLKENYSVETEEFELTEVVRQQSNSGILENATYIRNQLLDKYRNSFALNASYEDVSVIDVQDVVETYLGQNYNLSLTESIIVNYSNKSALEFNLAVREKRFKDNLLVESGDIIMINQNNYNYEIELLNGSMAKVLEVDPSPIIRSGMKSYDQNGNECRVTHKFRKIRIAVPDQVRTVEIQCLILENFLYSPNPSLGYAENIALYLDFKIRNSNLKPGSKEFKDALRADPYFNVLKVKYGYAITCHKAQGGEWNNVIVNMDVNQGKLSDNFLRWTYTAITRASNNLFLFNFKALSPFTTFSYQHEVLPEAENPETEIRNITFEIPSNLDSLLDSFHLMNEEDFKKEKFIEVLAIANNIGASVVARHRHNYQEIYVFRKDDKQAGISLYYNGRGKFTRILSANNYTNDVDLAKEIIKLFEESCNITIIDNQGENNCHNAEVVPLIDFSEEHQKLRVLYDSWQPLLNGRKIQIAEIKHLNFQEVYLLIRKNEHATIQFYYNGKYHFGNAAPLPAQCNSNLLLKDVKETLETLKNLYDDGIL